MVHNTFAIVLAFYIVIIITGIHSSNVCDYTLKYCYVGTGNVNLIHYKLSFYVTVYNVFFSVLI